MKRPPLTAKATQLAYQIESVKAKITSSPSSVDLVLVTVDASKVEEVLTKTVAVERQSWMNAVASTISKPLA